MQKGSNSIQLASDGRSVLCRYATGGYGWYHLPGLELIHAANQLADKYMFDLRSCGLSWQDPEGNLHCVPAGGKECVWERPPVSGKLLDFAIRWDGMRLATVTLDADGGKISLWGKDNDPLGSLPTSRAPQQWLASNVQFTHFGVLGRDPATGDLSQQFESDKGTLTEGEQVSERGFASWKMGDGLLGYVVADGLHLLGQNVATNVIPGDLRMDFGFYEGGLLVWRKLSYPTPEQQELEISQYGSHGKTKEHSVRVILPVGAMPWVGGDDKLYSLEAQASGPPRMTPHPWTEN